MFYYRASGYLFCYEDIILVRAFDPSGEGKTSIAAGCIECLFYLEAIMRKKKWKVHYNFFQMSLCRTIPFHKLTNDWDKVTCNNCLMVGKYRADMKIKQIVKLNNILIDRGYEGILHE